MQFKVFRNYVTPILCCFALLFFSDLNAQPKQQEQFLDSFINQHMNISKTAGLAGAVIVDNKIVWMKGYGYADVENKIPFTPATIMNAGSIAKTVMGVCMMRLVQEKKLSLDEDINTYLPFTVKNPHYPDEKITLRMIATHSSSLADRDPFYIDSTYIYGGDANESLGDFLKNYYVKGGSHYSDSNFYKARPGSYWEYSNIAASLAGYIVELKSGMKLNEYCKKILFKPLQMHSSGWFLHEIDISRHARLYQNKADTTIQFPLYGFTTYPDGGLRTSVAELSRFFIVLLNNGRFEKQQILRKETVAEMKRLQFTPSHKPENIDLASKNEGLFWRTKNNGTLLGHGGNDFGIKTMMLTDLQQQVGVVLFTNTEDDMDQRTASFYYIFEELLKYGLNRKGNVK